MTAEGAIFDLLTANAGVDAIAGDRISPHNRLQGSELPAVVYAVESFEPVRVLAGTADLTMATVSIAAIAETYAQAKTLAASTIAALNGVSGVYDGTNIYSLVYSGQTAADAGIGEGEEDLPFEIITEFRMHYEGL
jgi:hypothetical protein